MSKAKDNNDRRDGKFVPGTIYFCDYNPTLNRYVENRQAHLRRETDCRNTAVYAIGNSWLCCSCSELPRFNRRKKRKLCKPGSPVPVFGDVVTSSFDGLELVIVIGEPLYSIADSQRVIASPQILGAPYGTEWLTPAGIRKLQLAIHLRDRYLREYPDTLKPMN